MPKIINSAIPYIALAEGLDLILMARLLLA